MMLFKYFAPLDQELRHVDDCAFWENEGPPTWQRAVRPLLICRRQTSQV